MSVPEKTRTNNKSGYQQLMLIGVLFLVMSVLLYLIGIYLSRTNYSNFISNYPETNFVTLINPIILIAAMMAGFSVYLFARSKHEILLLGALILIGVYLWNTNSMIIANARGYDSFWHYSISQLIIDEHQFSLQDISPNTFYLNYPFTGIFGAELSLITNVEKERIIYYFPILISIILISFLYASTSLFFKDSYPARALAVMIFIIGNASLQTHFAPQTIGLVSFAFLFYLMFKYSQKPELSIKIMLVLVLFLTITIHPLTSFNFGLILIAYVFTFFMFRQRSISSSMVLLFFIFFFAWQTYWAFNTSTFFFRQLSQTATLIFTLGPFATGGTEYFVQPQYFTPLFFQFRFVVHGLFLTVSFIGWLILMHTDRRKWLEISCFLAGPVLYFIFTYFSYSSYLYERAIMFLYFPLSIAGGYLVARLGIEGDAEGKLEVSGMVDRLKFIDKLKLNRLIVRTSAYRKKLTTGLIVACIILAAASILAFGLQEHLAVVPTQDIDSSRFISQFGNGSILCFQSNAMIFFYNISSEIQENPRHAWTYWTEADLPADEREVYYKPNIEYIMLSMKYRSISDDYSKIKMNLDADTTMNRVYDNGFIQIYT